MLSPNISICQKSKYGSPKIELAIDNETKVQKRINIPLDFSELKKSLKDRDKGNFSVGIKKLRDSQNDTNSRQQRMLGGNLIQYVALVGSD